MAFVYGSFFSNPSNYWFQICSKVIGKLAAIVPVAISQVYFMPKFATDNGSSEHSASTKRDNVASSATLPGTVPMWVLAKEALWAIIPEKIVLGSFYFKRAPTPRFVMPALVYTLGYYLPWGHRLRSGDLWTSHRQNTLVYSKALHCPFIGAPSPDISWSEWYTQMWSMVPIEVLGWLLGKGIGRPYILYTNARQALLEPCSKANSSTLPESFLPSEHYNEVRSSKARSLVLSCSTTRWQWERRPQAWSGNPRS